MTITKIYLAAVAQLGRGRVATKDRLGFGLHASLGAIEAKLADARKRLAREQNEVLWLESLAEERKEQIAAGSWPPPKAS